MLNAQYVFNYNIMAGIVAIPAVVAVVCRVKAWKSEA